MPAHKLDSAANDLNPLKFQILSTAQAVVNFGKCSVCV